MPIDETAKAEPQPMLVDLMRDMTADRIAALPIAAQARIAAHIASLDDDVKRLKDAFTAGMVLAYHKEAQARRKALGKDTGAITIAMADSGYVVRADSPKKVEWDQAKLRQAMDVLRTWGEDPAEYMTMALAVPEARYNNMPRKLQEVFEPARTVSHGRPSFKIEAKKA